MSSNTKTALITGANGGIGRALLHEFQYAGYRVIALDVMAKPADLDCDAYVMADLNRYTEDQSYAHIINHDLLNILDGRLNVLVNNAAVQVLGGLDDLSRTDWQITLNVNLVAAFLLAQALLQELEKVRGSIINIGSIHSRLTKKKFVAYATSKAALAGMTKAMSIDLGSRVRVNAIEPAAIETQMLIEGFNGNSELYRDLTGCHPIKRIGTSQEVAKASLWLCSDACAFIHGACIQIDGGISNRLHDPVE